MAESMQSETVITNHEGHQESSHEKMPENPVKISQLVQLRDMGVPHDQVTWSRVTISSDRWICIRHDSKDESKGAAVTILNPREGVISFAGTTFAESVLVNPCQPVIALRAGLRFEVFNLETKTLLCKTRLHDPVMFWTWVNSDVIGIVTDVAVYHWDLWQGDCPPVKVFHRHSRLAFTEIVSYKTDASLRWLALTGLLPENKKITGITQLYNTEEYLTQCVNAHTACFTTYCFLDNHLSSTVLCLASREHRQHGKVYVIELGPYKPGNFAPRNTYDHIQFYDDKECYDFPVSLQVSTDYALLYMITKYGHMYLCDIETAACLCCVRISHSLIFTMALNTQTQGILAVNRVGQVFTADIKKEELVTYLKETNTGVQENQTRRIEMVIAR